MLDEEDRIWIAGHRHVFKEVVWVSHSLGSLISYNVFSDILHKCRKCRTEGGTKQVEQVENGIRAFVTLGSPLDKIRYLYKGGVLRDWPDEYLPGGDLDLWKKHQHQGGLWHNFYYTDDPVSGELSRFTSPHRDNASVVMNYHTQDGLLQIPGLSHMRYWNDSEVLKRILGLLYDPYVETKYKNLKDKWRQKIGLVAGAVFWAALLAGVLFLILVLARANFLDLLEKLHLGSMLN